MKVPPEVIQPILVRMREKEKGKVRVVLGPLTQEWANEQKLVRPGMIESAEEAILAEYFAGRTYTTFEIKREDLISAWDSQ